MTMKTKRLGKTDLQIPPIVFGGNVFGWTLDEAASFKMLDDLQGRGFTTIDTADVYSRWVTGNSGGESETILGKWMKARKNRDEITLITKVGMKMGEGQEGLSADYIAKACEASLQRLQTDRIDLYFSHTDDQQTKPEETLAAYERLIQAGKVRYLGTSNMSADRIEQSLQASSRIGVAAYQVLQPEYNLYARKEFEEQYTELVRRHSLGVITYYTLASGFLSGKYQKASDLDKSQRGQGVEKYLQDARGQAVLKALVAVAKRHDVQPAAVALAWVIANEDVTAPIASATKQTHLDAFEKAVSLRLSDEDMQQLNVEEPEAENAR